MTISLVEILKDAETLEKAFKILETKKMLFIIEVEGRSIINSPQKILLAQKDYVIIKDLYHDNEKIHPYGTGIVYDIGEQKK